MKIKDKVQFTVGIADVLLSIAVSVLAVIQHQEYKLIGAVFVLLCGIIALTNGIETKKQQKKKEEKYKYWAKELESETKIIEEKTGRMTSYGRLKELSKVIESILAEQGHVNALPEWSDT